MREGIEKRVYGDGFELGLLICSTYKHRNIGRESNETIVSAENVGSMFNHLQDGFVIQKITIQVG
jgi:hypothetical protein